MANLLFASRESDSLRSETPEGVSLHAGWYYGLHRLPCSGRLGPGSAIRRPLWGGFSPPREHLIKDLIRCTGGFGFKAVNSGAATSLRLRPPSSLWAASPRPAAIQKGS